MDISTYGGCILMFEQYTITLTKRGKKYNFLFEGKPNYKEGLRIYGFKGYDIVMFQVSTM
jgi:hypothetical protein